MPRDNEAPAPKEIQRRALLSTLSRELRRILSQGRKAVMQISLPNRWNEGAKGLSGRVYGDYETYRKHQALKLDAHRAKSIRRHDARFYDALRQRLGAAPGGFTGRRVLCLAARQGTEVRAFIDEGAFAVGIDLNPGRDNKYVVTGDFHDLQFGDRSVDVVFTNSLDHAFDLDRILSEVKRVLADDGHLICEVGLGSAAGAGPGFYESLTWSTVDDLVNRIRDSGFNLTRRGSFEAPWPGEQLVFAKGKACIEQAP